MISLRLLLLLAGFAVAPAMLFSQSSETNGASAEAEAEIEKEVRTWVRAAAETCKGPLLGVYADNVDEETRQLHDLSEARGAHVHKVFANTGASEAGIREDDVIYSWNGDPITDSRDLVRKIRASEIGEDVTLELFNRGERREVTVTLGERKNAPPMLFNATELKLGEMPEIPEFNFEELDIDPERMRGMMERLFEYRERDTEDGYELHMRFNREALDGLREEMPELAEELREVEEDLRELELDLSVREGDGHARLRMFTDADGTTRRLTILKGPDAVHSANMIISDRTTLGMTMQSLSDQLATYFGVEEGTGVLVSEVMEGPSRAAGLTAGDVIVAVDGVAVSSPADIARETIGKDGRIEFTIRRNGELKTATIRLDEGTWNEEERLELIPSGEESDLSSRG